MVSFNCLDFESEGCAFRDLSDQDFVWIASGNLNRPTISRPLFLYF